MKSFVAAGVISFPLLKVSNVFIVGVLHFVFILYLCLQYKNNGGFLLVKNCCLSQSVLLEARYSVGEIPTMFLKALSKWLWS